MTTVVKVTFSDGTVREYQASDSVEAHIEAGGMFNMTTCHPDHNDDIAKVYAGNPLTALGRMMVLREAIKDGEQNPATEVYAQAVGECMGYMAEELQGVLTHKVKTH